MRRQFAEGQSRSVRSGVLARKLFLVRRSRIHGTGVFAARRIPPGRRIIEYVGERITSQEADSRYDDATLRCPHVVLFLVDARTVIDAGVGGNEAVFINHSCAPNCEATIHHARVFIQALRHIASGEELTYDYSLTREGRYTKNWERRYRCRCRAMNCRGTLLEPRKKRDK